MTQLLSTTEILAFSDTDFHRINSTPSRAYGFRHPCRNDGLFLAFSESFCCSVSRLKLVAEDLKSSGLPHDQAKRHCSGYCRGTNRNHLKLLLAFLVARRCLHGILIDDHRKIRGFHYYFNVIIKDLALSFRARNFRVKTQEWH